jgi:hypothetical protein
MALTKTLIKNDNMRSVIHLTATAAADTTSIALTDFIRPNWETSSGALTVNIAAAYSNVTDAVSGILIKRGSSGTIVLDLHGSSEWPSANSMPALAIGNTSSIDVTFNVPGMLILDVRKISGYSSVLTNVGV